MTKKTVDYKEIKLWLGRKGVSQLASDFGLSMPQAYNILRGKVNNYAFLLEAVKRSSDLKRKFSDANKELERI
jgi:hypothetical protein